MIGCVTYMFVFSFAFRLLSSCCMLGLPNVFRGKTMPPKMPKRPFAMPVQPGLVSTPASSSKPMPVPLMCGHDRSGKKWYQNKKGKLRLLQAMSHRVENQTKNLDRSEYIDFDWAPMLKKAGSVLDEFRTGTKATLKRTTIFLYKFLSASFVITSRPRNSKYHMGQDTRPPPEWASGFCWKMRLMTKCGADFAMLQECYSSRHLKKERTRRPWRKC